VRDETIQIMNANGSNRRRLTKGRNPVWSPDGKALAFLRFGPNNSSIYTIHIDGSSERLLTRDAWVGFPDWGR
jgi:Tol biopolymer transport system component